MTTGIDSLSGQVKNSYQPNHLRLIWAIARKDLAEIVTATHFLVLCSLPIAIFLLYRLMVAGINNSETLDIAVYDLGNSQLVSAMRANPELDLHLVSSKEALQTQITTGEMSGLQIPANFDADLAAGEKPELMIWLNPARGMSSETVSWQRFIEAEILKLGQQTLPAQIEWIPIEDNASSGERLLNTYLFIIILTMVFFIIGTNLVTLLIAEEKEKKMGAVLINSPANPYHIALGKAVAGTIVVLVIFAIITLLNGGMTGNWPLALLYLAISLPVSLSISLLAGSLLHSSKQCNSWLGPIMIFFLIPTWFSTLVELPEPFGSIFSVFPTHFLVQGLNDALNHREVTSANSLNLTVWLLFMIALVALTIWRLYRNPTSIVAQT